MVLAGEVENTVEYERDGGTNYFKDEQILECYQKTEMDVEDEDDLDSNSSWCTWNGPQRFGKKVLRV